MRGGARRGLGSAHAGDAAGRGEAWGLSAAARPAEDDGRTDDAAEGRRTGNEEASSTAQTKTGGPTVNGQPPNKRLKLTGALVPKEAVVSCPGGHGLSSTSLAPAGGSPAA